MANRVKKFIAVLSASAFVFSAMPMAFAGEENEAGEMKVQADEVTYYNEDFTGFTAGTLVNMGAGSNEEYLSTNGMTFACGTRNGDSDALGISVKSDGTFGNYLYSWLTSGKSYNSSNARQPYVTLSKMSDVVFNNNVYISFDASFANTDTGWILTDGTNSLTINLGTASGLIEDTWYNFEVVSGGELGKTIIVIKNTDDVVVGLSENTTVLTNITQLRTDGGNSLDVKLDNLVVADKEYELPDEVVLTAAVNSLEIEAGQFGMTVEDGCYLIKDDVLLPADPDGSTVEWSLSQRAVNDETADWEATSFAQIDSATSTLKVLPTDDSSDYYVKVTATVTVNDLSDTKDFLVRVIKRSETEAMVYYNEDFSGFSGTLADLSAELSTNTKYEETKGITFQGETRSSGNSGISLSGNNDYISWTVTSNATEGRIPKILLSRTKDASKFTRDMIVQFRAYIPTSEDNLYVSVMDSKDNSISINAPYADKWFKVLLAVNESGSTMITYDETGKQLSANKNSLTLSDIAKIGITTSNKINGLRLDDLYIADGYAPVIKQLTNTVLCKNTEPVATVKYASEVNVTSSNTDDYDVVYTDGNVNVTSKTDTPSSTTITITAKNGDIELSQSYIISSLSANYIVNAGKANKIYYSSDKNGAITDVILADGSVIFNDVILPSAETVTVDGFEYNVDVTWDVVSGSEYLSNEGIISVQDKDAHAVTLKKTISYSKNGEVKDTAEVEYKLNVQFDYENVTELIQSAAAAANKTAEETKEYLNTFVGSYQVRFDAVCNENFEDIPSSATSNITLPTEGKFGSTITWTSNAPTVISNSGKYKKPSSTKKVVMTATIMSGASSETKDFTITVPGSSSSNGGGGGGSVSSTGTVSSPSTGGAISNNIIPSTIPNKETGEEIVDKLIDEKNEAENAFRDLGSVTWAREAINTLADKGIVNGKSETSFAPNDSVTRAEFAKMLMGVFGLNSAVYTTSSFNDVSTNDWYFTSVETAYNLGIIAGTGNGSFNPNALISRQEMAVMVQRAAAVCGKAPAAVKDAIVFADDADIADYAKTAVSELNAAGIINGVSEATFAPLANATRAQAAKILYSFL